MPCQLPDASLRICSHGLPDLGDGGNRPDSSLTSASGLWRGVLAVILQLFYLKNQAPTDPQFAANLEVVLARFELFSNKLAANRCDLWRLMLGRPPLYLYHCWDRSQLDCDIFVAHGPIIAAAAGLKKAIHDSSPHSV
jgi:hypothetical protein